MAESSGAIVTGKLSRKLSELELSTITDELADETLVRDVLFALGVFAPDEPPPQPVKPNKTLHKPTKKAARNRLFGVLIKCMGLAFFIVYRVVVECPELKRMKGFPTRSQFHRAMTQHQNVLSARISAPSQHFLLIMSDSLDYHELAAAIKRWGRELGFQQVGITDIELGEQEVRLQEWLAKGYHGSMEWLAAHGNKRSRPAELVPGTVRMISVRMDYLPGDTQQIKILKEPTKAYISRYAL